MGKSWIVKPHTSLEYKKELQIFLDFEFANVSSNDMIKCPCSSSGFKLSQTRAEVFDHLLLSPFPTGYTVWLLNGEKDVGETSDTRHDSQHIEARDDTMQDMVNDVFKYFYGKLADQEHVTSHGPVTEGENRLLPLPDGPNDKAKEFYELMRDGEQELYQGCLKYSKLSFLVSLYHIKYMCGMSGKTMTMIIELLHDAFENAKISKSFYKAKETIKKLGLSYKKIDTRTNDCINLEANKKKKLQPAKVLRFFPLIPQLQRLFMSSKTSTDMRWHSVYCHKDGLLRHPRDAEAWKKFDSTFPKFSQDPCKVRLALLSDGFNPFENISTNHNIWSVVLILYNIPPRVCMKQSNFILSMIIPGELMLGNDFDVNLQPLIDELKELWDGVHTFDALSNETFKMRATFMWTISDFSGYGILSGKTPKTEVKEKNEDVGNKISKVIMHGRKKYIELPYWEFNSLDHSIDAMHIEKNVCDNVINTLLIETGKSKDHVNARKDLQSMGIKSDRWPNEHGDYPSAIFTMTNERKDFFKDFNEGGCSRWLLKQYLEMC
ncbi:uncharacterized protein LOC132034590 [Lycium ferocissimum]|uniref:uncharacterized protein LOC132034590 n=1 Tax=Lycium ferocissimum TaxID=112874 RepID=UPI002814BA93|nr:uncharacterized protein LOC132034590 [Lycium ferocissimum]